MAGIDFGRIGGIISQYVDTDYIDIKRDIDGKLQEVYSNIPCHVAYASTDNPDPTTVDVKPIIQSITVHMQLWVDVRNNDFIVAKKTGSDGSLIATYSGRCGNPVVSQGRKKVLMQMNGTENDDPTPLPPKQSVRITIGYFSGGTEIQPENVQECEAGQPFEMQAPAIDGYNISECYIDGVQQESTAAYIPEVSESGYEVKFVYAVSDAPVSFRFLVNGLYTKDDGRLASGWHLYKKILIDSVSQDEGVYTITCDDVRLVHSDSSKVLTVEKNSKIVLTPGDVFAIVTGVVLRNGGKVTFTAAPYEPTEAEQNCYHCRWYD